MIKINEEIFRAYDIRGKVNEDLSPELVKLIGKAFGSYLLRKGTKDIITGYDSRATSVQYQTSLIEGLRSCGCNIIDVGLTLSSIVAFSRHYYKIDGAGMVTASHNPPEYNGFKLYHGINAIVDEEIQEVKKILQSGKFESGKGNIEHRDPTSAYFDAIKERVKIEKPLKIVVDCGNSTPSIFVPKFLNELGCTAVPLYCELDSTFPNHIPDPVGIHWYNELINKVKEEKADLGVMFDGDGDRVGFVDDIGQIWFGDTILTLLVREIIPKNPCGKVIIELKDSEMVYEETKRLGGIPIFWKTGHALLDHKVYNENALLCGETSCHFWVVDNWYCFDDAVYALARVLEIIAKSGKTLSELVSELPKYESTPEYRIACPENMKFRLVEELTENLRSKCEKIIDIDGIRGYIEDGWFLIRASNTQPILSIRCEAKSKNGLEKIKNFVKKEIDRYPYINLDWARQYDLG